MMMSPVPLAHRGPQLLCLLSNALLSRESRMPYRYNSKRTAGAAATILLLFQWHRKHLSFSDNNTSTTESLVEIEIARECGFCGALCVWVLTSAMAIFRANGGGDDPGGIFGMAHTGFSDKKHKARGLRASNFSSRCPKKLEKKLESVGNFLVFVWLRARDSPPRRVSPWTPF